MLIIDEGFAGRCLGSLLRACSVSADVSSRTQGQTWIAELLRDQRYHLRPRFRGAGSARDPLSDLRHYCLSLWLEWLSKGSFDC